MAKIFYKAWKPDAGSLATVAEAIAIIEEYQAKGLSLTLRQLHYQFVSRGLGPNTQKAYKRLGDKIDRGRLAGMIDWEMIVDRLRLPTEIASWNEPYDIIDSTARYFQRDRWADQEVRVEVWIEKDALAGVFGRVCDELEVPLLACRGYMSQSAQWRGAQRLNRWSDYGQRVHLLHFGDHDPSGIDMTRDIGDRFEMFEASVVVERHALTIDQVEEFNPPPNPTKLSDSRAPDYVDEFGEESWELDALDPEYLEDLARTRILQLRDDDVWDESVARDEADKEDLELLTANYDEAVEFVRGL